MPGESGLKVVTWNVNSVNARQAHLIQLIEEQAPDVIMLQELKCESSKFPFMLLESYGYTCNIHSQKSYNGVAILTKGAESHISNTQLIPDDSEARFIEVLFRNYCLISVYAPLGEGPKFEYKISFLKKLKEYMAHALHSQKNFIIGGDFNVALNPIDIYTPLPDSSCYAQRSRDAVRAIINMGYYDPFRVLYPDRVQYSWWDYRGRGYENNLGMRLDYFLVSPAVMDLTKDCQVLENYRRLTVPSDHAPVLLMV